MNGIPLELLLLRNSELQIRVEKEKNGSGSNPRKQSGSAILQKKYLTYSSVECLKISINLINLVFEGITQVFCALV